MASLSSIHFGGLKLDQPALAMLTDAGVDAAAKSALSDSLNTALKAQLASAATAAGYADLASLIQAIPAVDVVADKDLTLRDFVSREVAFPTDPAKKAAVEAAIAKLSMTTRLGDFLNLSAPINANPDLASGVQAAGLATALKTSSALASNAQLIDDFIDQYAAFKGKLSGFWNTLSRSDEFKAAVPELQLTLQLATLTFDNPSLVSALRALYPQMTSPRALTSLSAADWQQLITSQKIAAPASFPGATTADKVSSYAAAIAGILKDAFPGTYFTQGLKQAMSGSTNPVDKGVSAFLSNAGNFDILNTNLTQFLAQNGQTAFKGIDAAEQQAVTLKVASWQRIARVTTDFPTANSLAAAGFNSAYKIASTPRSAFSRKLSGSLGGKAQAEAIYGRAQQIASATMGLFTNIRQALGSGAPRVIGDLQGQVVKLLESQPSGIPNWQTLFGSLSSCACTDCRSVYSAVAYFVDLLQFLKNTAPNNAGQTALDVLLTRRPDLPYIKLNCENTDTPLPYVDLVNEILEGFVVANNGKLDRSVAHDTPKNATASQLSVNPEYLNDDAYNKYLSTAQYPPTLPFDRWLETTRTYLTFLGSGLYQVMTACQTGASAADPTQGTPSGIALACEYLTISNAECVILTGKDFAGKTPASATPLYQYYGYAGTTMGNGMSWEQDVAGAGNTVGVENFLQRMAISYDDLVALLSTRALNPKQSIMLQAPAGAPCDLTQTTIVDLSVAGNALQDAPTLAFIHRFIRLWRKLGWAIADLDKTLTALQATDIDEQFLVSLASVKQLQATLGLPLGEVLGFFANLDTDGSSSLYLDLFQNRTVLNPPDSAFQLTYVAPLPAVPALQFPSPVFPNLTFDATAKLLTLRGVMSDDELAQLKALSTDASYTAAITQLHQNGVAQSSYAVPLASLPPVQLPGSLNYDGGKHQISFTGAMPDGVRGQLNFSSDPAYQTAVDALYQMRTLWGGDLVGSGAPTISNHINEILAALRISAQDLGMIRTYTNLADTDPLHQTPLSLANLSALCRYIFLAQGLGLSVSDLLTVIALIGVDPFQQQVPVGTLKFTQAVQAIQASPFSIAQLNYLYRDIYDPNAGIAPLLSERDICCSTTLQVGLASIAVTTWFPQVGVGGAVLLPLRRRHDDPPPPQRRRRVQHPVDPPRLLLQPPAHLPRPTRPLPRVGEQRLGQLRDVFAGVIIIDHPPPLQPPAGVMGIAHPPAAPGGNTGSGGSRHR